MKKLISSALAVVMALSLASPFTGIAYADEVSQPAAELTETAPAGESDELQILAETQPEEDAVPAESKAAAESTAPQENGEPEENAEPEETTEPKESAGSAAASDPTEEAASEAGAVSEEEKTPAQSTETEQAAAPVQDGASQNGAVSGEEETASAPTAVEQVADQFRALPKAEDLASMTDAEREDVMARTTAAIDAYDALSVADGQAFLAQYGDLYDAVTNDLVAALLAGTGSETSDLSLQPMEETSNVYLTLSGYTADQLKNFPVDDIPGMLTNEYGESLNVSAADYTGAWFYFTQDEVDETHTLGAGETVDLWNYNYSSDYNVSTSYSMFLVLGNGKQMNDGNSHRYIVTVELNTGNTMYGYLYGRLSKSNATMTTRMTNDLFASLGMQGSTYIFYDKNYTDGSTYHVRVDSSYDAAELQRRGVKLDIYPMSNFLQSRDGGQPLTGAITDQVLSSDGYADTYTTVATADNYMNLPNLWCFVFTDENSGRILGYLGANFVVRKAADSYEASVGFFDGATMQNLATKTIYGYDASINYDINFAATGNGVTHSSYLSSYGVSVSLSDEYASDETYYVTLKKNADIKAVYSGRYDSEAAAVSAGAANITATILADASQGMPYGYPVTLGGNDYVTMVLNDGTALPLYFYSYRSGSSAGSRNTLDPNFQITGAKDADGRWLDGYIADMARGVQLDTYYRRDDRYDVGGYQLMLLNKEMSKEELEQIVPEFWTPAGVQVNSGVKVESGESNLTDVEWSKSMDNTVMYQVQVPGEKLRNYQVTFATVQDQAKLLVAGPDERFINLTADNNFVHDILVANIGKTDLTGIKVELIAPVHVKLDSYWTVGGDGNDTLPAFDSTSTSYYPEDGSGSVYNSAATLDSIAKVRLVADGEGEISGTLRITTDNGGSREIKLTGIAANPHIVSATLKDAVKYVPYSYMVVTDNMYKWNRSTFRIIDGRLPSGMMLYENTGEIYGNPTETGDFTFTVQVDYSSSRFSPSTATYTLHVADNTNAMVYNQTDEGYSIKVPLGVEQGTGTYDFYVEDPSQDQLFVSNGVYPEFFAVWLNGQRLIQGLDYTSESGSTRITIKSQTFATKTLQDGYNTIAMEFRVGGNRNNELKRTAQNFRLNGDFFSEVDSSSSDEQSTSQNNSQKQTTPVNPAAIPNTLEGAVGVTLRFYVKDAQGGPVVGATAELHSTPRYGTTDGNGCVVFSNVEFGSHTLKIYDANGNLMGSKSFVLSHGGFNIDGSVITVSDGALVDIDVKAADGTLVFQGVTLPQDQAAAGGIPQTGDDFDPTLWILLAVLALGTAAGLTVYKKKNEQV